MSRTVLVLVGALLAITACGASADRSAAPTGSKSQHTSARAAPAHNANDAAFLRLEVAHHGQAVTLAEMALQKTHDRRLRALARRINTVQSAQLAIMKRQLVSWQAESDHHDHVHEPPGNVSAADLADLRAVQGREFDRYWLQTMTLHEIATHDLAQVELEQGRHGPTRTLARELDAAQDRLTNELLAVLKTFPAN